MQISPIINNQNSSYKQINHGNKLNNVRKNVHIGLKKDLISKTNYKNNIKSTWKSCKSWLRTLFSIGCIYGMVFFSNNAWQEYREKEGFVNPEQTEFDNKKDAINYATDRIKKYLNSEEPIEYSVIIDYKNNDIVSERKGDKTSVANYTLNYVLKDFFKIPHHYIALHGHPEDLTRGRNATQTFSFQDFRHLNNKNCKESYVVNKHGQICLLRKKENFKQLSEKELEVLKNDFNKAFNASWANRVDVEKDGKIIHTFYDFQGMHAFWKNVADKYNLEYYTNYGEYEGIDAYEKYYYPELQEPQAPTSHKSFKLYK